MQDGLRCFSDVVNHSFTTGVTVFTAGAVTTPQPLYRIPGVRAGVRAGVNDRRYWRAIAEKRLEIADIGEVAEWSKAPLC